MNPEEKSRIEKAGGSVMIQRINGSLAVSRALGDFEYKMEPKLSPTEQLVSPEPDVSCLERENNDEFLLLACDGVWDVMSNEEVISFILAKMKITNDLVYVCNELMDTCLAKVSTIQPPFALYTHLKSNISALSNRTNSQNMLRPFIPKSPRFWILIRLRYSGFFFPFFFFVRPPFRGN